MHPCRGPRPYLTPPVTPAPHARSASLNCGAFSLLEGVARHMDLLLYPPPPIPPVPSASILTLSLGATADCPGMTAVTKLASLLRPNGFSFPVAIAFTWPALPKPVARTRLMAHTLTLPSRAPFAPPGRMDPPLSSRGRSRARPPSSSISPAPGTLHLFPSPLPPPRPSLLPPQLSHLPSLPLREDSCIAPSLAVSHAIHVSPRLEMP